jgi:hypothetical protein
MYHVPLLFHLHLDVFANVSRKRGLILLPCHDVENLSALLYAITIQLLIDGRLPLAAEYFSSMYQ